MLGPASARTLFAQMTSQSASTRTKWLTYLITMRAIHDVARPRNAAPDPLPEGPLDQGGDGHPVGDEEEDCGDSCVEVGVECARLWQEAPIDLTSLDGYGCHVEQPGREGPAAE